jgi:phosphoglycerol transferase
MNSARKQIWTWGALAIFVSLIPFLLFQLDSTNRSLTYPLYDSTIDTLFSWTLAKAVIEGHIVPFLHMTLPRMGAPFGPLNLSLGFPIPEQLQFFVLKVFGFFEKNPIRLDNLYYLFGYVLTSAAFFGSAIWLRIRPAIAFGLSLAFTYLNFHLVRYHHLALSQYWVLAPAAAIILKVLDGSFPRTKGGDGALFGVALFIGLWQSYYGYFFCGMYSIAWIFRNFRDPLRAYARGLLPVILGFVLAIGLSTANHFVALRGSTDLPKQFQRLPGETKYYRFRWTLAVLPTPNHRIPAFAAAREHYWKARGGIEGTNESIGFLAVFGLILGLSAVYRRLRYKEKSLLLPAGVLMILTMVFSGAYGISVWIAYLVSPVFRCVNRISPMFAATCLFALGTAVGRYLSRFDEKKNAELITIAVGISLALFAVWDQVPVFHISRSQYVALDAARKFVHTVESEVGSGTVLQLPAPFFPERGKVYEMPDYAHLTGPLFSEQTKWSYGAFKGTRRFAEISAVAERPTDINEVKKLGYVGIWIDRSGYPDRGEAIENGLAKVLGHYPLVSDDGRRSFFKL